MIPSRRYGIVVGLCIIAIVAGVGIWCSSTSPGNVTKSDRASTVASEVRLHDSPTLTRSNDEGAAAMAQVPQAPDAFTLKNAAGRVFAAVTPAPRPLDAFTLTDHHGEVFTAERLQDTWTFLVFGYTSCPDVCPLTLAEMNQVQQALAGDGHGGGIPIQYLFISVDPQRDKLSQLDAYVHYFNPTFIGATGTDAALTTLLQQLGAIFVRHDPGDGSNYTVDHTSTVFLIDPTARPHAAFPTPLHSADIASGFRIIQQRWRASRISSDTAALPEPQFDSMPPPIVPEKPSGAFGFSRYVFSRLNGQVVTTLCEGPRRDQVRCQRGDLPCSYLKLKALHESGAKIPTELRMTREELAELVSQLDTLSEHLKRYQSIDQACADGYKVKSSQVVNMGFHMANQAYMSDGVFDLRKPEILLFAMEGGEQFSQAALGDCVDGKWTGDPRHQIVGAAFILPTEQFGENHPAGFAGPLDNWHMHYHICLGTLAAASLTKEHCEAHGGIYIDKAGWMIHAYVVPEFDNPGGVFSIWNSAIWPKTSVSELAVPGSDMAGKESVIFNFQFESVEIEHGKTVTFLNADPFFHTVTAGTPNAPMGTFDSGDLFANKTFNIRFDQPGEYEFFCKYHPLMTGKVVVR